MRVRVCEHSGISPRHPGAIHTCMPCLPTYVVSVLTVQATVGACVCVPWRYLKCKKADNHTSSLNWSCKHRNHDGTAQKSQSSSGDEASSTTLFGSIDGNLTALRIQVVLQCKQNTSTQANDRSYICKRGTDTICLGCDNKHNS